MSDTTYRDAALTACYELGWWFTPLDGKKPKLNDWTTIPRIPLDTLLRHRGNVGLITGHGVYVVDLDAGADIANLHLPPTITVLTGKGRHLYYYYDGILPNSAGKLGAHIDTRGTGGQVVFVGSVHPETGHVYRWAPQYSPDEIEMAPLPQWIVDKLSARTTIDHLAAEIKAAPEGVRNATLNAKAFAAGRQVGLNKLARSDAERRLLKAALEAGLDEHESIATIASGLAAGIAKPRDLTGDVYIPGLHVSGDGRVIEQSAAGFADDVIEHLPADALYRRDNMAGEIVGTPGGQRWTQVKMDRMRIIIDRNMRLCAWNKGTLGFRFCSSDYGRLMVAHAGVTDTVRELRLMVQYPIYAHGFRRVPPGWHDGLYYDEPAALANLEPIRDPEHIHNVLLDLVTDFPFKSPADRDNFFGLLLTPIVSAALDGNRPMHLIQSPLERTGKSKLVNEVFGGVIIGRDTPSMQLTEKEEEREKRIFALLLRCESLCHFDNLPHYIDSPALASLLTTADFMGRKLNFSEAPVLPNTLTIVGTGNNVQASGEIAKRCIPIMIEPRTSTPETRTNFAHPDIRGYVRENRRTILACLLGMVENWLESGRRPSLKRLGGFEAWSETVGGILEANAFRAWRTNENAWRRQANPAGAELLDLVTEWHRIYGLAEVAAPTIRGIAQSAGLFAHIMAKPTEAAASVAFGRMLGRHVDAPIGSWHIRRAGAGHSRYRLDPIEK